MLEPLILTAFSFFNTMRVVSYIPQMLKIIRDTHGATAVSYVTWSLWVCANGSTAAYAGVITGDRALCIVSTVNTLCCSIVIGLTIYKRWRWRAAADAAIMSWATMDETYLAHATPRRRTFARGIPHIAPPPG